MAHGVTVGGFVVSRPDSPGVWGDYPCSDSICLPGAGDAAFPVQTSIGLEGMFHLQG